MGKNKVFLYPVIHEADSTLPFLWVGYGNVIYRMKDNNTTNFLWEKMFNGEHLQIVCKMRHMILCSLISPWKCVCSTLEVSATGDGACVSAWG